MPEDHSEENSALDSGDISGGCNNGSIQSAKFFLAVLLSGWVCLAYSIRAEHKTPERAICFTIAMHSLVHIWSIRCIEGCVLISFYG